MRATRRFRLAWLSRAALPLRGDDEPASASIVERTFALGAWRMYSLMADPVFKYVLPFVLLVAGLWIGYRAVNLPTFADFLIAVEAEMNKVSWPSRHELVRASMVVIFLIFGLTVVLFGYDLFWGALLKWMGIVDA